jgi:hypothetical protein
VGPRVLLLPGASRTGFVRIITVILLLGFAAWVFLGNYDLLFNSHAFMTGADYVDQKVTLPCAGCSSLPTLAALPWRGQRVQEGGHPGGVLFSSCNWLCRTLSRRLRPAE